MKIGRGNSRSEDRSLLYYQQKKVNNYDVGVATLALQAIDILSIGSQFAIHIVRRQ